MVVLKQGPKKENQLNAVTNKYDKMGSDIFQSSVFFHLSLQIPRNADAPKHDRIVGFKATAVKVLLDLPEPARNCILRTVSMYGWESHKASNSILFFWHWQTKNTVVLGPGYYFGIPTIIRS